MTIDPDNNYNRPPFWLCKCDLCRKARQDEKDADAALEAYKARLDDQAVLEKTADAIIESGDLDDR